jgi:hypothetical protein
MQIGRHASLGIASPMGPRTPPAPPPRVSSPACHLHSAVLAIALGRAATQRRPHRGRQVLCAEAAVPKLQPHEQRDGLLPHLLIFGPERPHIQRRHAQRIQQGCGGFCPFR